MSRFGELLREWRGVGLGWFGWLSGCELRAVVGWLAWLIYGSVLSRLSEIGNSFEFICDPVYLCSFERELKNKLSEKTRGAQSEEQVLMKAFKYFDLNDNGTVEPDEFAKAIEKIGIQIPTRQVRYFIQLTIATRFSSDSINCK